MEIKRHELKYFITYDEYIILRNRLKHILKSDPNHPKGEGYFIRSLYFDTLQNKHFWEKQAGIETRRKLRLRIYSLKDKKVKFEIKNKFNNLIFKETAIITKEHANKIQKGDFEILLKYKNPILNKIYHILKNERFIPIALIDYIREAYYYDLNNIRITFDKLISTNATNLNLSSPNTFHKKITTPKQIIMEVKYNKFLPKFIKNAIQVPRFTRESISKYCLGRLTNNG